MCSLVLTLRQVGWNPQRGEEVARRQGHDVETLVDREFPGRQPRAPRARASLDPAMVAFIQTRAEIVSFSLKELGVPHGQLFQMWPPHLKAVVTKWNDVLGKLPPEATEGVTGRGLGAGRA